MYTNKFSFCATFKIKNLDFKKKFMAELFSFLGLKGK